MPDVETFATFAAASAALTVVPGPAVLYVVSQSIHGGRAGRASHRPSGS
jgi:threonine/homoserine/homoserine lactone efflux protein